VSVVFFETVRRHLANAPFLVLIAIVCTVAAMVGAFGGPPQLWQSLVKLLAIILACQLIGPEFSSGTLQFILAKPVNRSMYVVGRVAGVVVAMWVLTVAPFVADAGGRGLVGSGDPAWAPLIGSTLNLMLAFVLIAALMALYGSFTRSYYNVALYFVVQIVLSLVVGFINNVQAGNVPKLAAMGEFLAAHTWVQKTASFIHDQFYADAPALLSADYALLVAANAAIIIVLASMIFLRREVPYGAD
jgi:ABC-type transport system involved in multi-copper enzyme maturation permease subunit